jgi:ankyrin repeat protein
LLLQQSGVEVNARAENGATALVVASLAGYDDVVRELLRHSEVNVNIFTFEDGATALHHASAKNQKKIVEMLLEKNELLVNATMNNGATALHLASNAGHAEVVCALLENNEVNVDLTCISGLTARGAAARNAPQRLRLAVETAFQNYDDALLAVPENRDKLANAMTTKDAKPVELSYQYIKRYLTKPKLGSGAFGDVFLAKDGDLPEPKAFVVKKIKLSKSSDDPNDNSDHPNDKLKTLQSFQKELSVRSGFCIECCIVWNNQPWPHLPRVLTIMHNFARHSKDFVIPISLSCTATISMAVLESSFWCMNMQPMAPSTASSRTMT